MVLTRVLPVLLLASTCAASLHQASGMPMSVAQAPLRLKGGFLGGSKESKFDPTVAQERIDQLWKLDCDFGREAEPKYVYFEEIIPDRFSLTKGIQLIRDELCMSFNKPKHKNFNMDSARIAAKNVQACAADLSLPSVLSTCAYTVCGDRICQSGAVRDYTRSVAGRFGSLTEFGDPKPELFFATGGGTDSGPTLAHVTVAHAWDPQLKKQLYEGNAKSYVLANIDISTHCGHLDIGKGNAGKLAGKEHKDVAVIYGMAQESIFRDPRAACGAIVGMLAAFNLANGVHVRLRNDLGEKNYQFLTNNEVKADDGSPINFLVAACIISVQGMMNTLEALGSGGELDERGVGHTTAQVQINNGDNNECILYCARGTVFRGEMRTQGLGTDASKYSGKIVTQKDGSKRIRLIYDNREDFPIRVSKYEQNSLFGSNKKLTKEQLEKKWTLRQQMPASMPSVGSSSNLMELADVEASAPPTDPNVEGKIGELEAQLMAVRNEVRDGWQELRGSISDIVSFMAGDDKTQASETSEHGQ
eukprot:CAMPEP_0177695800 /NCGR_PEP_ID=MMETSP0484_2-20121128/3648_1 /TAXON_ID=354590 /ORGANISM="Rhodomonas lens, Strain RHODO" /LENGTH=530 /DNA_ID=CAMNT_0019206745 /DNA_START=40 /DNA_END=1632 /DNA_ORIENTATION=-